MSSENSINKGGAARKRLSALLGRVRRAFSGKKQKKQKIMFILNPAAGQGTPDLRTFNRIVRSAGFEWAVEVTNQWGDGARLAREAVKAGVQVVAAYGGDGTVLDVATGLVGSDVPLAIIPGGTGNALAKELNLPFNLSDAATQMVLPEPPIRKIDVGMAGEHLFLLRLGIGIEAEIIRAADRALKDRLGLFAYLAAAVQVLNTAPISHYQLRVDGQPVEIDGLACMVANAGTIGVQGLSFSPRVRIDDGLLDVFVIRKVDLAEVASFAASMMGNTGSLIEQLPHWQCRELSVQAEPAQGIEADGEELACTPIRISVIPQAIQVIAPPPAL